MAEKIMDVLGDRVLELGPKPEPGRPYNDFRLTRDADGVAWLLFDRADSSANTLSAGVIEGLECVGPLKTADDIVTAKLDLGDGRLRLPQGPGLGVTLDEEKVSRYAYAG